MTVTEKTAALTVARAQREGISEAEAHRRQFAGNSLQRAITAADIASVVTFLASPKAVAITGDVIAAGGGGRGIYY